VSISLEPGLIKLLFLQNTSSILDTSTIPHEPPFYTCTNVFISRREPVLRRTPILLHKNSGLLQSASSRMTNRLGTNLALTRSAHLRCNASAFWAHRFFLVQTYSISRLICCLFHTLRNHTLRNSISPTAALDSSYDLFRTQFVLLKIFIIRVARRLLLRRCFHGLTVASERLRFCKPIGKRSFFGSKCSNYISCTPYGATITLVSVKSFLQKLRKPRFATLLSDLKPLSLTCVCRHRLSPNTPA
jgi:hypothetical protein